MYKCISWIRFPRVEESDIMSMSNEALVYFRKDVKENPFITHTSETVLTLVDEIIRLRVSYEEMNLHLKLDEAIAKQNE